jgi:hippurate hydrolase
VTRTIDVFNPAVVTVGQLTAGTTSNVIPERARIFGTIRAVTEKTRLKVREEIERVARGVAAAHGADIEVTFDLGYPVTINNDGVATWTREVASAVLGADRVNEMPTPIMGAEDFSYVLERAAGTMVFLGMCPPGQTRNSAAPNHSNRLVLDDSAMAEGIALYSAVALEHLAR